MEGAAPAGFVEEVDDDVEDEADAVSDGGLVDLVFRGDEGPVDEKRAAYDVFPRDKAPVAAIQTDGAVVSHGEIVAGGND